MTAVLDLHPHPGHPGVVVAGVHEALDGLGPVELEPGEYAAVVTDVDRAVRRLEGLKLRLVAAAEKAQVPQQSGARSAGAWVARQTRSGSARGARDARLAGDLDSRLPDTADALGEGEISGEHAEVIAHAVRRLPAGLTPDQVATVEASLVGKAKRLDPHQLRRAARRALAAVEPDPRVVDAEEDAQVTDEEEQARARSRLTLHDNGDGTTTGHFTVPTLAASILRKVLDAMTAPRRTPGRTTRGGPGTDWAHARGEAFSQVLEHLPVDHLHGKVAATVVVTLDLEVLRGQLKAARLDTGDLVSAAEARRLACQAGLVPAVLDGPSLPLDLGRQKRLFTEAQHLAGATRHTSCAADGCQVPYAWCELHHRRPWAPGGPTDLRDMVPLCGFHHRRIHAGGTVPLRT
ncbi:DUF222 domain-containing protein [Nocardioides sp. GXQ0305]|uniref:HNH endonuclease signature motif containing protein n=1 Tax=Nocardioides sp. GXQ0305 TaxID=3423912 RepID=UPI003D7E16A1